MSVPPEVVDTEEVVDPEEELDPLVELVVVVDPGPGGLPWRCGAESVVWAKRLRVTRAVMADPKERMVVTGCRALAECWGCGCVLVMDKESLERSTSE